MDRDEIIDRMKVEREDMTRALMIVKQFAKWKSIDRGEIIHRMKIELDSMARALMFVKSLPSS